MYVDLCSFINFYSDGILCTRYDVGLSLQRVQETRTGNKD